MWLFLFTVRGWSLWILATCHGIIHRAWKQDEFNRYILNSIMWRAGMLYEWLDDREFFSVKKGRIKEIILLPLPFFHGSVFCPIVLRRQPWKHWLQGILGNLGCCHSCGCYFNRYHSSKQCWWRQWLPTEHVLYHAAKSVHTLPRSQSFKHML